MLIKVCCHFELLLLAYNIEHNTIHYWWHHANIKLPTESINSVNKQREVALPPGIYQNEPLWPLAITEKDYLFVLWHR